MFPGLFVEYFASKSARIDPPTIDLAASRLGPPSIAQVLGPGEPYRRPSTSRRPGSPPRCSPLGTLAAARLAPVLGWRPPGRVVSDHAGGFPVSGQHDFRGGRAARRQFGREPDPATVRRTRPKDC